MDILSFILTRKPRNSNFLSISIREIHLTGKLKPSIRITNLVYKPYVVAQAYLKIQDRFSHYYTILAFLPHPLLNCLFLPREAAPVGFLNSDGREQCCDLLPCRRKVIFQSNSLLLLIHLFQSSQDVFAHLSSDFLSLASLIDILFEKSDSSSFRRGNIWATS